MKNAHCSSWSIARKPIFMDNEKHTLKDLKYGKKP